MENKEIIERLKALEKRVSALEKRESSDWMTINQAVKSLHISRTTFYEWVKDGRVTLYKISEETRAVRVKRSEIDQLFKPVIRR